MTCLIPPPQAFRDLASPHTIHAQFFWRYETLCVLRAIESRWIVMFKERLQLLMFSFNLRPNDKRIASKGKVRT